jgi:hypothetical protein
MEFNKTRTLVKTKGYMDRLVKEAIEIKLHRNINRWRFHAWPNLVDPAKTDKKYVQ